MLIERYYIDIAKYKHTKAKSLPNGSLIVLFNLADGLVDILLDGKLLVYEFDLSADKAYEKYIGEYREGIIRHWRWI